MPIDLLRIVSLVSVAAFAGGAVIASRHRRMDMIGAMVVAVATALGGGVVRDAILGIPSQGLRDPAAMAVCFGAALAAFALPSTLSRWATVVDVLDAIGIGLFNATGMAIAWEHGAHPQLVLLLGTVTAAGGGIIRDVLLAQMPTVMQPTTFYVTACIVGGLAGMGAHALGWERDAVIVVIAATTTGMRLLAMRFGWTLDRIWDPTRQP